MGCSSCSSGGGVPNGCKNNGSCGVSGCNKLEVFDWLAGMTLPDGQKPFDVVEVRFKNDRKNFYRNSTGADLQVGEVITVESSPGQDVGVVSVVGELTRLQLKKKAVKDNHELRKVIRKSTEEDIASWQEARQLEQETMMTAREVATSLQLVMKISDVEYQADKKKATFHYTAEGRVDFRELIRKLAEAFKVRIEMKQIGMRQEASKLGGIGSCGRELCCSTWFTDFRSVSTSAARYQQLALNPQKLAGQCGKLKCCLNYELDQYLEAVNEFPSHNTKLETVKGRAFHFKSDIFKKIVYYIYEGQVGGAPIALPLENVLEIVELNKQGKKPDSLGEFEIEIAPAKEIDYANVVGQDSLTRFDGKKRSKGRRKNKSRNNKGGNSKASNAKGKSKGAGPKGGKPKGGKPMEGNSKTGNSNIRNKNSNRSKKQS